MSLKLVELQVAYPRTHDAGKMQEQLNQRSQLIQDQLAIGTQKEEEKKSKRITENQESNKTELNEKQKNDQNMQQQQQQQKKKKKSEKEKKNHPFKGNTIDFSG